MNHGKNWYKLELQRRRHDYMILLDRDGKRAGVKVYDSISGGVLESGSESHNEG